MTQFLTAVIQRLLTSRRRLSPVRVLWCGRGVVPSAPAAHHGYLVMYQYAVYELAMSSVQRVLVSRPKAPSHPMLSHSHCNINTVGNNNSNTLCSLLKTQAIARGRRNASRAGAVPVDISVTLCACAYSYCYGHNTLTCAIYFPQFILYAGDT